MSDQVFVQTLADFLKKIPLNVKQDIEAEIIESWPNIPQFIAESLPPRGHLCGKMRGRHAYLSVVGSSHEYQLLDNHLRFFQYTLTGKSLDLQST